MERTPETKASFIIAAERNGKTPKRKPSGAQPSDKKSEKISKRPDTVLTSQTPKCRRNNCKLFASWEWCREPVKIRANES